MLFTGKPVKFTVYQNTYPYKTIDEVQRDLGCDFICNGYLFNCSTLKPVCNIVLNGELLSSDGYTYRGYAWNDGEMPVMQLGVGNKDNFISCSALVNDSKALTMYGTSLNVKRGRTAIGFKPDGTFVAWCSTDKKDPKTMYQLRQLMLDAGCETALALDGGGSSSCITPDGRVDKTDTDRIITSFVCVWIDKKEDDYMFKIALGAGHYLGTAGKRCLKSLDPNETREWWLNDRICDKIESALMAYEGYRLQRLDDTDGEEYVSLDERVDAVADLDADIYISVHHNAGINGGKGGGIMAFSRPGSDAGSIAWRNALYNELISATGLKGNRASPIAEGNYKVLRDTTCDAVLLELGFMDSKTDVPVILTEEFADHCAEAIVRVLVERGKLSKKKVVASSKPVLYKAQVGAFASKANATRLANELKTKGYSVYVVRNGALYRVQVGAFSKRDNCSALVAQLKQDGYTAYVTVA